MSDTHILYTDAGRQIRAHCCTVKQVATPTRGKTNKRATTHTEREIELEDTTYILSPALLPLAEKQAFSRFADI